MGPTRKGARSGANDGLTEDEASPKATSSRASPYLRTPSKQVALRSSASTPASRTGSPRMIREIFQMISPFRAFSRASRSAAFGGDTNEEEDGPARDFPSLEDGQQSAQESDEEMGDESVGTPPRQMELPRQSAVRSASPVQHSSLPAPLRSLPLADRALVTPGIHKYSQPEPPRPATQSSPVSRNYDLLAQFFAEKQRGGSGGLSDVEVEGCIRLIEDSMAEGRDLQSEFQQSLQTPRPHFAPAYNESRASSLAPSAFPSSQTMGSLFHPGTRTLAASSSAYSFLAPRPMATSASGPVSAAPTRRRPLYLGPGMSGLSLNRRRTIAPTARSALNASGGRFPRSASDSYLAHEADEVERQPGPEEAKRRRPNLAEAIPDRVAHFDSSYERRAGESSALAKQISTHGSPRAPAMTNSPLKRAAPSAVPAPVSPPKVSTRTASALQDILKASPPVRQAAVKPELVNPYQSIPGLVKSTEPSARPIKSARADMLARAKAKEVANAKSHKATENKFAPPKESVLDLIERTAPKPRGTTKSTVESTSSSVSAQQLSDPTPRPAAPSAQQIPQQAQVAQQTHKQTPPAFQFTKPSVEPQVQQTQRQAPPQFQFTARHVEPQAQQPSHQAAPPKERVAEPQREQQVPKQVQVEPLSQEASNQTQSERTTQAGSCVDARKAQRTEEVQRRLEALAKAKRDSQAQQQQKERSADQTTNAKSSTPATPEKVTAAGMSSASLVPPQYTASKPKKPSPLSAAFRAPDSPGSESDSSHVDSRTYKSLPSTARVAVVIPTSAPISDFSFSVPSSGTAKSPATAPAPAKPTSTLFDSGRVTSTPKSATSAVAPAEVDDLPTFNFEYSVPAATQSDAEKSWKAEIQSVAESALPKFSFTYEVETQAEVPTKNGSVANTAASSVSVASSPAPTESQEDNETSGEDPSKVQSSGLLGEGEGEEGESTEFEVRAKFWKYDTESKTYKDLGICIAKVKSNNDTHKRRLLARNEANGKVAVNFHVYKSIKVTRDKNVCSFLGFSEDGKPTQFRVKIKTDDKAEELKDALDAAAALAT